MLVSLAIAAYNRDRYLAASIESVLAQTYLNWDLVIGDDGSDDDTLKIAQSYARKDNRIRVIAYPHRGVSATMKDCISKMKGDYIGWVDSDDWLHPDALKKSCQALNENLEYGACYSDYQAVSETGDCLELSISTQIPYSRDRLLKQMMTHHFRLLRHYVYEDIGGIDTDFKFNYDYDLCLRLSQVTDFWHVPQVLYYRRMHKDSITGSHRAEQIEYAMKAISKAQNKNLDAS